jgi:hypothetical protein
MPCRVRTAAATLSAARSLFAIGTAEGTVQLSQTILAALRRTSGLNSNLEGPRHRRAQRRHHAAGGRNRTDTVAVSRLTDPARPLAVPIAPAGNPRIFNLVFSTDATLLAAGAQLWNLRSGAPPTTLTSVSQAVKSVAFTPDAARTRCLQRLQHRASVGYRYPGTPTALPSLTGPTSKIYTIAISPDGRTHAAGTANRAPRLE